LRSSLGAAHFEKREKSKNSFNRSMKVLAEEYAFGEIWARPGLEPKIRSLLVVAMLAALGRSTELKTHVNGALNNGCTPQELEELLLQVAVYCGLPAGFEALRVAEGVLTERGLITPET
jgi:4-carboxymuconolactone decarboxylase